jgi:hypothetical protein
MPPNINRYVNTTEICDPVADVFGRGPDAVEIMGWDEAAQDVHHTADTVVAVSGWGEHPVPERNALEHACASCVMKGCVVREEIESRASRKEEAHDPSLDNLSHPAEVASFMRMPALESLRDLKRGEPLLFPEGTLPEAITTEDVVLPSMDVVTPKGIEVTLVPLYAVNPDLNGMCQSTMGSLGPNQDGSVFKKAQEVLIRAVDTTGDMGVHHINGTSLGRPTYYNLDRGSGRPVVYVSSLGEIQGKPAYGILTATTTPKEQLNLIKIIGGDTTKQRFRGK